MDAEAKALAVRRRKSLLQYLKRNGLEPPTPTRTTTWAPVGVISVGTPSARPVARVLGSFFATSTTKHFVHTRPEEEMVTDEAWDDADADDTVSDRTSLASASTATRPGALTVDSWMGDDVARMVWEELGTGGGMLGGRGCARLACTCRAAWHMLREHLQKAKDRALPEGLDFWLACCLEKRQQVRLLEKRTAAETRELNPRGTVLHGCPHAKALPYGPYHEHDFDSVVVVVCPANARDNFRIGEYLTLTPTPTLTLTLTPSASLTLTLTLTLTRYPRAGADVRRREHRSEEV